MAILNSVWNWFGSWVDHDGEPETNPRRKGLLRQLGAIEGLTNRIFVTIIIFIALYSIAQAKGSFPTFSIFGEIAKIFGILLGVMVAFAIMGGFLGFLFGIPRLLQHPAAPAPPLNGPNSNTGNSGSKAGNDDKSANATAARRFFSSNTNLEEISDWITKIIVGLSLVQAGFIFEKIKKAAFVFKTNALPDAVGADVVFVLVMVASVIAGFLFFYMETRTRITLLFADLENVADEPVIINQKDLNAVLDAPIAAPSDAAAIKAGPIKPSAPNPIEEDKKILDTEYDDLNTADQLAAWASAQARANNYQAAIRALQDAIAKKPDDGELLVRLADVQQRRGNARAAYDSISEARQKSNDDPSLLRREMHAALYLNPPESFQKALAIAEKLKVAPTAADDPAVQLWMASAQGQRYKWLLENNGNDVEKAEAKAQALSAVQRILALEPSPDSIFRALLRDLLDPTAEQIAAGEDDLKVFSTDPEFRKLIAP